MLCGQSRHRICETTRLEHLPWCMNRVERQALCMPRSTDTISCQLRIQQNQQMILND